ncbi:hypothetical protein ACH3VR_17570 [Microbacterium sp. B2969]|uniref:Ig-like domain-containing protein n=1 Tax=Microbacterium alkaliflavum TaxID=3248839 RepID=A0ABW7QFM3_9MICO
MPRHEASRNPLVTKAPARAGAFVVPIRPRAVRADPAAPLTVGSEGRMARIGGRNLWLAWPAGLVCAGVVAALVYLAVPAVPGTVQFVGDTLRAATSTPVAAASEPVQEVALGGTAEIDCRDLYPGSLWSELAWSPNVLLTQNRSLPPTAVTALVDALQPDVRVTCVWKGPQGTVVSSLSRVGPDAATVADPALRGQGFSCEAYGSGTTCRRTSAGVREEHTVRDGLWLASVETTWMPEDYGARLAAFVWS